MPPGFPAHRLMICEVVQPGGNWSSYPPHKHDTDDPPREERISTRFTTTASGFPAATAFSVVHAPGDETLRVVHGDVVAIREGFHPFCSAHGYDAYT